MWRVTAAIADSRVKGSNGRPMAARPVSGVTSPARPMKSAMKKLSNLAASASLAARSHQARSGRPLALAYGWRQAAG